MVKLFNKFFCIFKLLMCILILSQCKSKSTDSNIVKVTPPLMVDVMIAAAQPISNIIEANGNVIASEFVELRPEVSGRLIYLNIAEGKTIVKGTIVARVNNADLKATLGKNKVQLDLAQKTVARYKQLLDINGLNQADFDAALNTANGLKADVAYTEALLEKTIIRAPFTGIAGLRQVSPGAYVSPTTILATLQQTSQVKIDFTLPEVYGSIIHTGMTIAVEMDAVSKERGKAQVIATEPGANTNTRNLKVRALLLSGTYNPGGFVKVFIDAGKNRSSIKIPTNCIIPDDKNNQVVLVKNGLASFVNIQTGVREASTVEVVKGINVGDTIVVTGVLFARPKSVLTIRSIKPLVEIKDSATANY